MILDKYKGKTKDNRLLPVLSNQRSMLISKRLLTFVESRNVSATTLHVIRLQRCCSARVFPLSPFQRCWDIPTLKQHKSMRVSPTRKLSRIWCKSPTSLMASKTVSSINRLASVQSLLRGKRPVTPLPSRIIPTGRYGFSILYLSSSHFYPSECCRNRLPEITSTNASVTSFHIKTKVFFTSHNANRSITRISQSANRISKPIRMQTGNIYIRSNSSNMVICF